MSYHPIFITVFHDGSMMKIDNVVSDRLHFSIHPLFCISVSVDSNFAFIFCTSASSSEERLPQSLATDSTTLNTMRFLFARSLSAANLLLYASWSPSLLETVLSLRPSISLHKATYRLRSCS